MAQVVQSGLIRRFLQLHLSRIVIWEKSSRRVRGLIFGGLVPWVRWEKLGCHPNGRPVIYENSQDPAMGSMASGPSHANQTMRPFSLRKAHQVL